MSLRHSLTGGHPQLSHMLALYADTTVCSPGARCFCPVSVPAGVASCVPVCQERNKYISQDALNSPHQSRSSTDVCRALAESVTATPSSSDGNGVHELLSSRAAMSSSSGILHPRRCEPAVTMGTAHVESDPVLPNLLIQASSFSWRPRQPTQLRASGSLSSSSGALLRGVRAV